MVNLGAANRQASIFIVTIMRPTGETGVQTHSNALIEAAKQMGVDIQLITPFGLSKALVYPVFGVRRFVHLLSTELGVWWYRYWHFMFLRRQLFQRLSSCSQPAIVCAQDPLMAKAALDLRDRGYPIEVVLVVHFNVSQAFEWAEKGYIREGGWLYGRITRLERQILSKVDRLLFPSEFMQQQVTSRVPEAKRVPSWVIPSFVPRSEVAETRRTVTRDLISIGTVELRKNHEFLLRALKHIHQSGYLYQLTIVGEGFLRRKLKALAVELGLDKHVKFTGYLPNAASLIPHHRAYVHAARIENFPLAIVEALAAGRPIFAAPVGGIPEAFTNGVEGFYWDLDDPREAAELLIRVLEDQVLYKQMSWAAQKRYESHFSPEAVYPKLMGVILGPS